MADTKQAYVSPPTGNLDITIIRDANPRVTMALDLGIPNFTVFSMTIPLVEGQPQAMSGLIAESVHVLLDEVASFMMSVEYAEEIIVQMYATVLAAFKGMSQEADTSKEQDETGADPTVKTFEGTFNLPISFVNETQKKVVTAAVSTYRELVSLKNKIDRIVNDRTPMWPRWEKIKRLYLKAKSFFEDSLFISDQREMYPALNRFSAARGFYLAVEESMTKGGAPTHVEVLMIHMVDKLQDALESLIRLESPEIIEQDRQIDQMLGRTGATKIKRMPKTRHIELTYEPKQKTTVNDAARVIRQYRNRSLKQQPKPLYVVVYDQMGRPTGTLALGPQFKNKLLQLTTKRAAVEFVSPLSFSDEQSLKAGLLPPGIPEMISVGGMTYLPEAVAGHDMALYHGPQDYLVKFPDGRSAIFPGRPTFRNMRRLNFPVPRNRFKWTILPPPEPKPEEQSIKGETAPEPQNQTTQNVVKD